MMSRTRAEAKGQRARGGTRLVQRVVLSALVASAIAMGAGRASAQSRPLATEDPETVGAGQVLFEAGVDYAHDQFYPASGLQGNLWRIGTFGFNFGVSSIAEIQLKGGVRDRLSVTNRFAAPLTYMLTFVGDQTGDFPDA